MAHKTQDTKFSRHRTVKSARFPPGHAGNGKRETGIGSIPNPRYGNRSIFRLDMRDAGKQESGLGNRLKSCHTTHGKREIGEKMKNEKKAVGNGKRGTGSGKRELKT